MKLLCFIEGSDGAGKTTCINSLQEIFTEKKYTCSIVNKDYPTEYKALFKVDERYNIVSSKLAKFSYRVSRLYLAIEIVLQSDADIIFFDGGYLNLLVRSMIDGVDNNLITLFANDIKHMIELKPSNCTTLLLDINANDVYQRNLKRPNPSQDDLDKKFLAGYEQYSREIWHNWDYFGIKKMLPSNELSKAEIVEQAKEIIQNQLEQAKVSLSE